MAEPAGLRIDPAGSFRGLRAIRARERRQCGGNRAFAADDGLVTGRDAPRGNNAIPDPASDSSRVQIWPAGYLAAMLDDVCRADDEIADIEMMTVSREIIAFGWARRASCGVVGQRRISLADKEHASARRRP